MIYGTVVTSAIAMAIAIPISIGIALATTFFLPHRLRTPLAGLIDLLAAVPSVVYGLWGIVVMVPFLNPKFTWVTEHQMITVFALFVLSALVALVLPRGPIRIVGILISAFFFVSWFLALIGVIGRSFKLLGGPVLSGSYMSAGLVLAVMVVPIITAITREVFVTVPREQEEAAYALGSTRWEMVRDAVLPWSRSGIVGASTLGLGRAFGETIAIAILIGDQPNIGNSIFGAGSTLAGWIALQTGEATGLQLSALTALAVVLFGLTLLTNLGARLVTRRSPSTGRLKLADRVFLRRATGEVMPNIAVDDSDGDFARRRGTAGAAGARPHPDQRRHRGSVRQPTPVVDPRHGRDLRGRGDRAHPARPRDRRDPRPGRSGALAAPSSRACRRSTRRTPPAPASATRSSGP